MQNKNVAVKQRFIKPLSFEGEGGQRPGKGVPTQEYPILFSPSSAFQASSPSRGKRTRAFTLIELLVVVLIIGILAAVAVPQYKKAVIKSRVATILPVLSGIIQAQEVYYLANGEYTANALLLDLQPPTNCTGIDEDNKVWKCGNDFILSIQPGTVSASYCPKHNSSFDNCKPNRDFQIGFGAAHSNPKTIYPAPNSRRCWKPNNSSNYGEEICKALGKLIPGTDTYELY